MYKLFNLDAHVSVISDVKDIFQKLYGDQVEITNWSISDHRWVFGFPYVIVKHITQRSWKSINKEMIATFQKEYDTYLSQFDGFIVTHTPVFALLFEKYNKPIIVVNSCRYNQPFCWNNDFQGQHDLNNSLQKMTAAGQLHIISNNKADQEYLRMGTGIESTWIPSLCAYTNVKHDPDSAKPIALTYGAREHFPESEKILNKRNGSTWKDMFACQAIIHRPYEVSTMSIFEQYTAGVPLFVPSKEYSKRLAEDDKSPLVSVYMKQCHDDFYDAFEKTFDLDFWIDRADFYDEENMPYVYYYDSPEDAIEKAANFKEDFTIRAKRDTFIVERQVKILTAWDKVFKLAFKAPPQKPQQAKGIWDQGDKNGYIASCSDNIGQINKGSLIGDMIYNLVQDSTCKTFLEIGTWNGMGSTKCIVNGLKQRAKTYPYNFWSLECNSEKSAGARKLYENEANINILNEVLFNTLPSDIYEKFPILNENADFRKWLAVDIKNMSDKPLFLERTDLPEVFDFVFLDGGEFTTYYDFMLLKDRFKTIMIDDINTQKGPLIRKYLLDNPDKYQIVMEHNERNGFLIGRRTT
jgi:hypothetical protein